MANTSTLPRNIHSAEHGAGPEPFPALLFAAYVILPLLRYPLGYEIVRPLQAIRNGLIVAFLPYLIWILYMACTAREAAPAWGGQHLLILLSIAATGAALVTFAQRMRDQRTTRVIHTAEAGYSWLTHKTRLPIPLCEIVLMPALIGGLGWLIYSPATMDLSIFLMIAGVSYFRMAWWEHSRKWSQVRAVGDDLARAGIFEDRLNQQTRGRREKGRQDRASPGWNGQGAAPDMAEMASGARRQGREEDETVTPPDMAAWRGFGDNIVPDTLAWFRGRRR